VEARIALGNVLCESKKMEEAIKEYKNALNIDPTNVAILYNLGIAYS